MPDTLTKTQKHLIEAFKDHEECFPERGDKSRTPVMDVYQHPGGKRLVTLYSDGSYRGPGSQG